MDNAAIIQPYMSPTSNSIDRNIGIQFTDVPESSVVPPGDLVFFACKTDLGKGKA